MPNTTKENEKQKKETGIAIVILILLILLTLISGILLSIRLVDYITIDDREVFLESNLDAQIELFSVEYKNASGEITVKGANGEKVIAPGTAVEYTLKFRNTDKTAIDYDMIPNIHFTSEYELPILVRMLDTDGSYLVGNEDTWVEISELNSILEHATLKKGESVEYVFEWKWEFESGNDEYDTELGNASVTTDIGVIVEFSVHAEANTNVAINGGFMDSGLGCIVLWGILLLLLLIAIILLTIRMIKKYKRAESYERDTQETT